MHNLKKFYKNKKVLITGITGFKGTWLAIFLKILGAEVYGYSLKAVSKNELFAITKLSKIIKVKYKNISNYKDIENSIKTINPQIIFHLAAQAKVSRSYVKPFETYNSNINGTINILEVIKKNNRKLKLKSLVFITSDKCYKNLDKGQVYKESDKLGGSDPYSISKACAEVLFDGYLDLIKNDKLGLSSARAGNVIGGGDFGEDRLIPDIFKTIYFKKKLVIRDINSVRPWQHVLDVIYGYLILAQKNYANYKYNGSWNFSPNKEKITVKQIVKKLKNLNNLDFNFKTLKKKKFIDKKILILSSTKAKQNLKWQSKYNIDQSLKKICEWYNFVYNKKLDPYDVTSNQINDYLDINK